jgi:hypothetical protein
MTRALPQRALLAMKMQINGLRSSLGATNQADSDSPSAVVSNSALTDSSPAAAGLVVTRLM